MKRMLKFLAGGEFFKVLALAGLCLATVLMSFAVAQELNAIKALDVESDTSGSVVKIQTELPVGYRYTVYDSFDPVRVVIDFPGMDTSELAAVQSFSVAPIQEVRVSSFDLESGKLGRVEILLEKATNYEVALEGDQFQVLFSGLAPTVGALGDKLKQPVPAGPEVVKEAPAVAGEAVPAVDETQKEVAQQDTSATAPVVEKTTTESSPAPVIEAPVAKNESADVPAAKVMAAPQTAQMAGILLLDPVIGNSSVELRTSTPFDRYQYFKLGAPPRLVVDIYGTKPDFKARSFTTGQGLRRMRVGTYDDKTRLVFDAESETLPDFNVSRKDAVVMVAWGESANAAGIPEQSAATMENRMEKTPVATSVVTPAVQVPVTVEALDFSSKDGQSVFTVKTSRPAELLSATQNGDTVKFGVNNALISQKLRRTVDASAFPSAVKLITPYTVQNDGVQEVRFAVELKGPTAYAVDRVGNQIQLVVQDGPFAEERILTTETKEVALSSKTAMTATSEPAEVAAMAPKTRLDEVLAESSELVKPTTAAKTSDGAAQAGESIISASQGSYRIAEEKAGYTGEKISLVFDNADIRKILQLIAEVSDLNIIASDEVKGNITLRLQEVPWDQALDLIMDIQDLGMVKDGNIARIMPRNRIRAMEEAKLTAKRTKEKLEDLVTEVISISYTDLTNIETPAKELLTDRGKITKDDRNKQIIVTDIPSVISDVRNLVAILDTPERQVMIEARIVEASSTFGRDLGVKWGLALNDTGGEIDTNLGLGGNFLLSPPAAGGVAGSGLASSITFGTVGLDDAVLNLRLSALETSGKGKIVSSPRVTTLNGEKAKISQGTQIPYTVTSTDGVSTTEFIEAALSLEVTPVINPDGSIILEIKATNSTPGTQFGGTAPSIDSKEAETKVLVHDGETTVLGGIYVEDEDSAQSGVPWLGSIPFVGHLFKSTTKSSSRSELLVFITPRILQ